MRVTRGESPTKRETDGTAPRERFMGYIENDMLLRESGGDSGDSSLSPKRRLTDMHALINTRDNWWRPSSPESIRKAGEDFRKIR